MKSRNGTKEIVLGFRYSKEGKKRLEFLSSLTRKTVSSLLREALDQYLEKHNAEIEAFEFFVEQYEDF